MRQKKEMPMPQHPLDAIALLWKAATEKGKWIPRESLSQARDVLLDAYVESALHEQECGL